MKKKHLTLAVATAVMSLCLFFTSCEKNESVEPEAGVVASLEQDTSCQKGSPLSKLIEYIRILLDCKIDKDYVPYYGAPIPPNAPIGGFSLYSYVDNACITDDNDYADAPFDIVTSGYLIRSNHGIVYAIDSLHYPAYANWVFSDDTLSFSDTIVIKHKHTLQLLG